MLRGAGGRRLCPPQRGCCRFWVGFSWEPTALHVTNAINSKSSLYLRSRRQLHTAGHYPLAGSVQHLAGLSCSRRGEKRRKANALSPVPLPPPPSSARDWGRFAAGPPGEQSRLWAGRAWGPGGTPPRGKSPENWRSSSLPNRYPSRLPSSQKGPFISLRSDGLGPARTGPPPAPAIGKRLRASVSPSCRPCSYLSFRNTSRPMPCSGDAKKVFPHPKSLL